MEGMARRSALALGVAAAATPAFVSLRPAAAAETYGPDEGKEVAPGVRQVDLGERESLIPAYTTVSMRDIVFQPGSNTPNNTMKNDMVCHITEDELRVVQNDQKATYGPAPWGRRSRVGRRAQWSRSCGSST
jgi:hypothetical protein